MSQEESSGKAGQGLREGKPRPGKERFSVERIAENIRRQVELGRKVERLACDQTAVREHLAEGAPRSRQQQRWLDRQLAEMAGRELRLRKRDDAYVAEVLRRKAPLEGIFNATGPTDVDELLHVMEADLGGLPLFAALSPPSTRVEPESGKTVQARFMYPPQVLGLVSMISRYMSVVGAPEVMEVVLTDPRYMSLLSFTLEEVEAGATRRSVGLTGKTRDGRSGKFEDAGEMGPVRNSGRSEEYRGALSSETVAGYEGALPPEALEATMNGLVRAVAQARLLPKKILGVLDSTGLESVPSCLGTGAVRKKVKVETKARRPRTVEVTIRGFKVWVLMDAETAIPLAIRFSTIEKPENECVREIVLQAKQNVEGYCTLVGLAVDRGFLDGDFLWWAKQEQGIDWVCPAKEGMLVTKEARDRVTEVLVRKKQGAESPLETAERLAGRSHVKLDGVSFFEAHVGLGREPLLLAGVDDLTCTEFYGEGGANSSRLNSKHFRPTPLHATVVLNWPDRPPEDRQDENDHDGEANGPVVLLSPIPEAASVRFQRYDQRSLIENRVNREAKEHHSLGTSLVRTMEGTRSATYFSLMALLLARVLEIRIEQAEAAADRRAERLGLRRYRRKVRIETRHKVMVYADGRMGLIKVWEFAKLAGYSFG